jgi:hypothetical protein|tara:strand:- start:6696 stop:7226 length:531 start_codon:yes stop_codon:yes gene_type:complete
MSKNKRTEKNEGSLGLFFSSIALCTIFYLMLFFYVGILPADEIVHEFKSPSFNGVATSSHYLTIDEQEKTRRDEEAQKVEDALKEAEREAENTTLAKFLRNLESRIYSQLSRDIAESLFDSEKGGTGGSIELEGSTITFVNDGINITLTVTDADGNVTTIIIPVGIFGICSEDCGI